MIFCVWLLWCNSVFKVHPCCTVCQYFIHFCSWILSHYMDISYFVYPFFSVDGQLFHFCLLAVMSNAALNIHVPFFVWIPVFNSFGFIPEGGIAESRRFLFGELPYCFPQRLYYFTFSPVVHEGSSFSTSLPILVIFLFFFDYSHLCRYEMVLWILFAFPY